MNLYLTRSGRLRRKDNTLSFEMVQLPEEEMLADPDIDLTDIAEEALDSAPETSKHALPIETIDAIYLFGEISVNTRLLNFLAQKKVPVHVFNYYGHHAGSFFPHAEQLSGDLVVRQAAAYTDLSQRIILCRQILGASIHNILSLMLYYFRRREVPELRDSIEKIRKLSWGVPNAQTPNELMGIEGTVRRIYYSSWKYWLGETAEHFSRTYHPPETPLNALISFVNSLLYTACVSEIYRTALYPGISYLHSAGTRRFSLALDLTEPFKPVMCDRLVFRLWNTRAIQDKDFMKYTNGYILTDEARKKILGEWDTLLRATVFYKNLDRSVSYRQLLRLDCYKLIKFLLEGQDFMPFHMEF